MTKSELRAVYLEKQKSLSVTERSEKSSLIAGKFFEYFDLSAIRFLHVFLPIEKNKEVDTFILLRRLRQNFPRIITAASRLDFETMRLSHFEFNAGTKLTANKWRIPEPTGTKPVETEKIDAVLVPLLCLDERGFRVGYGKGFYDKFLSECRADCLKIGLSYFAPITEISDAQKFDVPLDFGVTPLTVLNFKSKA